MASNPHELSLDVRRTYVPKTISDFLGELTSIGNVSDGLARLDDFVKRLEEEKTKIDAFKRELPLCMLLLNDAIVTMKEEEILYKARKLEPVLAEFIPLKKNCDEDEANEANNKERDSIDKMNWMSSVQLWNGDDYQKIDSNSNQKQPPTKVIGEEEYPVVTRDPFQSSKNRTQPRAFVPFQGCSVFPVSSSKKEEKRELAVPGLSLLTPRVSNAREEIGCSGLLSCKAINGRPVSSSTPNGHSNLRPGPQSPQQQQQQSRKQRRCWSPELHRRFVAVLEQLGGSQVATPKQIRDLMQVDGLTNDEVKSHLQKYRLHTRRVPTNAAAAGATNQARASLGDLWMAQNQYGESSKPSSSQSGSPQGPLQLNGTSGGASTTGGESMEEEDEDAKSESYSWRGHLQRSGKDDL